MTRWCPAAMASFGIAASAGCACEPTPNPTSPLDRRALPASQQEPPLEPAPEPRPPLEPARTLELAPAIGCPRAGAGLPGQPAPDPVILAGVIERPWCLYTGDGIVRMTFTADGTLAIEERGPDDSLRATRAACWALAGAGLLIHQANGRWHEWPVQYLDRAHGGTPTLLFRREMHRPCTIAVAPEIEPA